MRRYINITGNLAVGCTTLAIHLAESYGWIASLERDVQSPFLGRFYADPRRWAFHNQAYFITQSLEQHLDLLRDPGLAEATVVQDYTVYDPLEIYAKAMAEYGALSPEELSMLERMFNLMVSLVRPPDVLVYLKAPISVVWRRVRERARQSERTVDLNYLQILQNVYDKFIEAWRLSPVVTVDADSIDFRADSDALHQIGDAIQAHLEVGSLQS